MKRATLSLALLTLIGCGGKDRDVATGMNRETPALATVEREGLAGYVGTLNHDASVGSAAVSVDLALYRYALLSGDLDSADAALDQVMRAREPISPAAIPDSTETEPETTPVAGAADGDVEAEAAAPAAATAIEEPARSDDTPMPDVESEAMRADPVTPAIEETPADALATPEAEAVPEMAEPMTSPQEPAAPVPGLTAEAAATPAAGGGRQADHPAWQRKGALRD